MKDRRRVLSLSNLLLALIGFLFITSAAVSITLHLRQLYYLDVRLLGLSSQTGLTEETIKANYDALIDYNLIEKRVGRLEFPDFPMSDGARIHFMDVKHIFYAFQIILVISAVILLVGLIRKFLKHDYGSLRLMSVLTLVIPIVLGILVALNWERFFIGFHEIMFSNDYWIFNPLTDPVINILPEQFFMHCAILILVLIFAGFLLTNGIYRRLTK